jgi:hypothetical protein
MKILWIEDDLDEAWLGISKDEFHYKHIKDFSKAHDEINKNISAYDFIILDMNLEGSDSDTSLIKGICERFEIKTPQVLLTEGGYYLFIQLMINKFPSDRILCFTGNYVPPHKITTLYKTLKNASNSVDRKALFNEINTASEDAIGKLIRAFKADKDREPNSQEKLSIVEEYSKIIDTNTTSFIDRFREARIPTPKIISKGDEKEKLPEYLGRFSNNHYILLRRGIINASHYFVKNTEGSPNLHSNIKVRPELFSKNFDADDAILLIESILGLLPIEEPSDEGKNHIVDEFIRLLAHHWDSVDLKKINNLTHKDLALRSFVEIMKTVRNWSAHNNIFMHADYSLCSFIFLIQMRALFKFPDTTQDYENELLKIIGTPCEKELFKNKEKIFPRELRTLYIKIFNDFSDGSSHDFRVPRLINSALLKDSRDGISNEKYLNSLYDYFWFTLSKPKFKASKEIKNNNVNVLQIEYIPFPFSKMEYLTDFARHFYTKSFVSVKRNV